jgi:hypothetical protein
VNNFRIAVKLQLVAIEDNHGTVVGHQHGLILDLGDKYDLEEAQDVVKDFAGWIDREWESLQ